METTAAARDQLAGRVELPLPVAGPLPQQGARLRAAQRQPAEERQHRAGLGQGQADDVGQEGQHHQDLAAILAARGDAGDRRFGAAGPAEQAVADQHGAALAQPPDRAPAKLLAVGPGHAVGVDVLETLGRGELQFGRPTPRRFLAALAGPAALFFRPEAVRSGRGLRVAF
jgi:hypothetical protein